jgi:hypothetical protein
MKTDPPHKRSGIVAVNEEQLEGVNNHKYKLDLQNVDRFMNLLY